MTSTPPPFASVGPPLGPEDPKAPDGDPPSKAAPADSERRQSDLELARRCAAGDRAAQRLVFDTHIERIHRVLYRILGGGSDVEDAAQEAVIRLFRSLPKYRGEATLATWSSRIAVRVAIDQLEARRRRKTESLGDEEPLDTQNLPADEEVLREELSRRLQRALERLAPQQRVAFVLNAIEGHTASEIAEMMGASLVATKARVWRARRELERCAKRDTLLATLFTKKKEPK